MFNTRFCTIHRLDCVNSATRQAAFLTSPGCLTLTRPNARLDEPKRVFYPSVDTGLGAWVCSSCCTRTPLGVFLSSALRLFIIAMRLSVLGLNFVALFNAPVTRIGKDTSFFAAQQRRGFCVTRHGRWPPRLPRCELSLSPPPKLSQKPNHVPNASDLHEGFG